MKGILTIATLFFSISLIAQVHIDFKVKSEFDSLFRMQPKWLKKKKFIKDEKGIGLVADAKTDTINMDQYQPIEKSNEIVVVDTELNSEAKEIKIDTSNFNQWLSCMSSIKDDTLYIGTYFGFFAGMGTITKIYKGKSESSMFMHIDQSEIYRNTLSDKKDRAITVKAISEKVVLNKFPKKAGDVFYGKISFETEPYYEDENYTFKNGYINKKEKITILFMTTLGKEVLE